MALKAGEPWRIVRSLAWEVACVASISIAGQQRAKKKLLPFCEAVAKRVNRPEASGMLSMAEAFSEQHKGHWKESHELFSEAERILGRCKDVSWELFTVRLFKLHNLSYLGQYRNLREQAFELLKSAKERGDLYIESFVSLSRLVDVYLASNQPAEARAVMDEVMSRWSHTAYHLPYAVGAVYGPLIDLYEGKPEAGLDHIIRHWPLLKKHQHLRAITFRDPAIFIRMRLELSAAARSKKPQYLLKLAERDAKHLANEGLEWLSALAQASYAAIASMQGNKQEAINLLRDAERAFSALHMAGLATAARYTIGVSMGDERGQDRIREAEAWLKAEGIVKPRRWVNHMIPGFISEP